MSFIALALTLCVAAGTNDDPCNTYFIDAFAGDMPASATAAPMPVSMADQWGDCMDRLDEETKLARAAAMADRATKPTAKDGSTTIARTAYLSRFNIKEDVQSIARWEFGCARINEDDTP